MERVALTSQENKLALRKDYLTVANDLETIAMPVVFPLLSQLGRVKDSCQSILAGGQS